MIIHQLELRSFRNYEHLSLSLSPGINIFLGANAQGKTNIVEAVYYAAMGSSHRTHTDAELIRWEAPSGRLSLSFDRIGAKNTLSITLSREKRREILRNEHPIRPKELIGGLRCVLFSPEDLFLIKGAPAGRRRFLDGELSQASPAYYQNLMDYNKLLQQRGALLKRIRERQLLPDALAVWDQQLAAKAAAITQKRLAATKKLSMLANLMQRRITDNEENLLLTCILHGSEGVTENLEAWYNEMLQKNREKDILRGTTSVGPHRDDLALSVNGTDLRAFGSQGQQRTGALALKLSELEFLRSETGEYPVLLLDDVMSELDITRRRALLAFLRRERIQTILTATDEAYFPDEAMGVFYRVRSGRVSR